VAAAAVVEVAVVAVAVVDDRHSQCSGTAVA